ncbi:MAG: hypothetical protein H7Y03_00975, partial [Chitinophagaceae bacterium]|nr:hypothetical protein [Chitinophagaceae bacterium]
MEKIIIIAMALCFVIISLLLTRGLELSDPALYIQNGLALAEGKYFIQPTVMSLRIGMILSLAMIIQLFGLNFHTLIILPLIFSVALLFIIIRFFKGQPASGIAAIALFGSNTLILTQSTYIGVDLPATLFLFLAFLAIIKAQMNPGENTIYHAFFTGTGLVCSFLFKELIIFAIPALLFFLLRDIKKRRNFRFWLLTVGICIFFISLYFMYYQITTGDFMYRLHVIEQEHNISRFSFYERSKTELLKRITYQPLVYILLSKNFIIPFLLCIGYFTLNQNIRRIFSPVSKTDYVAIYFLITLGTYWWGSTSFNTYNPLPTDGRMWLVLIPPMIILAASYVGFIVGAIWHKGKAASVFFIYVPLVFFLFFSFKFIRQEREINKTAAEPYFAERRFIDSLITNSSDSILLITDSRLASLSFIYSQQLGHVHIESWELMLQKSISLKPAPLVPYQTLILVNSDRATMLYEFYDHYYLPDEKEISRLYPAIFSSGNVNVYRFTENNFSLRGFPGKLPRSYKTLSRSDD